MIINLFYLTNGISLVQFSHSVVWLCDPMDCSTPAIPVHHQIPELLKLMSIELWCHPTISSSLLLLPSFFPSIRVFSIELVPGASALASVLPMNIHSGLVSFRIDGLIFLLSKGLSRIFSNTAVRRHQFFGAQPSLWFISHIHAWLLEKP